MLLIASGEFYYEEALYKNVITITIMSCLRGSIIIITCIGVLSAESFVKPQMSLK